MEERTDQNHSKRCVDAVRGDIERQHRNNRRDNALVTVASPWQTSRSRQKTHAVSKPIRAVSKITKAKKSKRGRTSVDGIQHQNIDDRIRTPKTHNTQHKT